MTLTPYKESLEMSKEAVEKALVPIRAKQAKRQGELKMMEIDDKILTLESEIKEITIKHPLDYDKLLDKLDRMALLERKKKQFGKVIEELFGAEG